MAYSLTHEAGAAVGPAVFWSFFLYGVLALTGRGPNRRSLRCALSFLVGWSIVTLILVTAGHRVFDSVLAAGMMGFILGTFLLVTKPKGGSDGRETPSSKPTPQPPSRSVDQAGNELRSWLCQHTPTAPSGTVPGKQTPSSGGLRRRIGWLLLLIAFSGTFLLVGVAIGRWSSPPTQPVVSLNPDDYVPVEVPSNTLPQTASPELSASITPKSDLELFRSGRKLLFNTTGHEKARGLRMQIAYPETWKALEGSHPNVVQKLVSQDGRGTEVVMIMTRALPEAPEPGVVGGEVQDVLSREVVKECVPDGGRMLSYQITKLDGERCAMVEYEKDEERAGMALRLTNLFFIIPQGRVLLMLHCLTVGERGVGAAGLDQQYAKTKPLFIAICSSCVLLDQWQTP